MMQSKPTMQKNYKSSGRVIWAQFWLIIGKLGGGTVQGLAFNDIQIHITLIYILHELGMAAVGLFIRVGESERRGVVF